MSSQRRRTGRITGDEVTARVARGRADIATILDQVLDDEAALARIYATHGQQPPAGTSTTANTGDESGQVQAACDRIAMLETALTAARNRAAPASLAWTFLGMAVQFLAELRSGLASRSLSARDAFRLLTSVRHDLREADTTLGRQQQVPLDNAVLARLGELRDLISDLAGELDALSEMVMRLFGHADKPSVIPVPQH